MACRLVALFRVNTAHQKDGLSVDQGRLIIEKYLKEHPESLHEEAGLVAGPALLDAFPCKK
jgi:hypothetical protein